MNTVTSKDGTTIAFDRSGEGPAIVLVGGAFQHRAIDPSTARLAELLAPSFTVYHYDRRGRGDSGDAAPYAVEREIEDIDALIQDAGGSASLFGMSSGAVLALEGEGVRGDAGARESGMRLDQAARSIFLTEFISAFWLAAKVFFVVSLYIWFRASFPRYRYDQIMRLGWKVFIPITLVWLVLIAVWVQTPWNIWRAIG